MLRFSAFAAAWVSLAVIAYATLSRIGVVYDVYETVAPVIAHPSVAKYVHFEHIFAFAIVGIFFSVAYPRRTALVCLIVLGGAALLEFLQTFTPDRHATLDDAIEKICGGITGITLARGAMFMNKRL